jgi:predicted ATPase
MIDHLQLENFKAFRQLSLRLAPLTLLSGVNAAGKSTVMQPDVESPRR